MGSVSFMFYGIGATANEVYSKAKENSIVEYGTDSYNGTVSTTNGCFPWGKTLYYPNTSVPVLRKLENGKFVVNEPRRLKGITIEEFVRENCLEKLGKRDCAYIDMGIDHYERVKMKTEKTTEKTFLVCNEDGRVFSRKKSFEEAKKKLIDSKVPGYIEESNISFRVTQEIQTFKKKPVQTKNSYVKEIHKFLFFGWAAE